MKSKQLKEGIKEKLFKGKKEIVLTEKNLLSFLQRMEKIGREHIKEEKDSLGRTMSGDGLKPEDLDRITKALMKDIGSHLDHVDFIQHVVSEYKIGQLKRPAYKTYKQVDQYRVELAKLFHTLSVKLRMARMFGFGEIEGVVSVVDTSRLPTSEKAKKMYKKQMKDALKKATKKPETVSTKTTDIFDEVKKK